MNAKGEEGRWWQKGSDKNKKIKKKGFAAYQGEALDWPDRCRNTQWQQHPC